MTVAETVPVPVTVPVTVAMSAATLPVIGLLPRHVHRQHLPAKRLAFHSLQRCSGIVW